MFQTKVVEKIKTHILCSVSFFRKSRLSQYNVIKRGRAGQVTHGNTTQRRCWVTKATHTHSEYVILRALPQQQLLRERVPVHVVKSHGGMVV
jgi:hypothetical protein